MEEMEEQALQYNQLCVLCEFLGVLCEKQHETSYSQAAYAIALDNINH